MVLGVDTDHLIELIVAGGVLAAQPLSVTIMVAVCDATGEYVVVVGPATVTTVDHAVITPQNPTKTVTVRMWVSWID